MTEDEMKPPAEIEQLLPWHAAGALSRSDAARVEEALARDAELQRQFAVIREELIDAIRLNEKLGAPSPRALERLLAGIEAEAARSPSRSSSFGVVTWLSDRFARLSPRTVAWSAMAAALAIVLQAGLLAGLFISERSESTFQTASYNDGARGEGVHALVAFAPQATAADITAFLQQHKATLVEGPRGGGLYKVRIAGVPKSELGRVIADMQNNKSVVRFAAPTE